jgi:hypothetical protein
MERVIRDESQSIYGSQAVGIYYNRKRAHPGPESRHEGPDPAWFGYALCALLVIQGNILFKAMRPRPVKDETHLSPQDVEGA